MSVEIIDMRARVNRKDILRLTREYGGEWLLNHAQRLLRLIAAIGEGMEYSRDILWIAAHLHDWGSAPRFARRGTTHSVRSMQLAQTYMKSAGYPQDWRERVIECIEFHHGGSEGRSVEAMLFSDADALDGLGIVGLVREFAALPSVGKGEYCMPVEGLREAYERGRMLCENNPRKLRFDRSRELARERVRRMEEALSALEVETFGFF